MQQYSLYDGLEYQLLCVECMYEGLGGRIIIVLEFFLHLICAYCIIFPTLIALLSLPRQLHARSYPTYIHTYILQVLGCKSAVAAWMEDNNMGALYELRQASRVLVDGVIEVGLSLIALYELRQASRVLVDGVIEVGGFYALRVLVHGVIEVGGFYLSLPAGEFTTRLSFIYYRQFM